MYPQLESLHIAKRPKSRYIQTFCFKIKDFMVMLICLFDYCY